MNPIVLGRALAATEGPLVIPSPKHDGVRLAVFPQGGAFPPHMLGVGSTRGGKTSAARYWTTGLVRDPTPKMLNLADGKYAGSFKFLTGQRYVVDVANTGDQIAAMIDGFYEEVEKAYEALDKAKDIALVTRGRPEYVPPIPNYLILDEYMNWALSLPEKPRKAAINKLVRIGSIGGEVDHRMWILTQRPDSASSVEAGLPGLLKSLLMCRVAQTGIVGMHELEARMAFDDTKAADRIETYADRADLKNRRGLGMVVVGRQEVAYKANWMADPLHPLTSDEDREAAWKLLQDLPPIRTDLRAA